MTCICKKHTKFLDIVHEGSMQHISNKGKRIKNRWWVIDGVRGTVSKFSNEHKIDQKGKSIHIVHAQTKIIQEGSNLEFTLVIPGRRVKFVAKTIKERDIWIDALTKCSKGLASGESKNLQIEVYLMENMHLLKN